MKLGCFLVLMFALLAVHSAALDGELPPVSEGRRCKEGVEHGLLVVSLASAIVLAELDRTISPNTSHIAGNGPFHASLCLSLVVNVQ